MSFPRYSAYKDSGVEWLGEVPQGWQVIPLKYFTNFSGGGTPSRDSLDYWNGDIPWVSPKDMKVERISSTEEYITEHGLKNSSSSLITVGQILIVVRSGILKHTIPVAINDVPVTLNQDMKALCFNKSFCINSFFFRWVQGLNDVLLLAWAKQGATVESIEHNYLAETLIPLPPIQEQTTIAAFLDCETAKIDNLINEQKKLIELLKEKRQAVISTAVTKGLNPHAPMKDSGVVWLGEVPQGWTLRKLISVTAKIGDGLHGTPKYVDESEYYFINGNNLVDRKIVMTDKTRCVSYDEFLTQNYAFNSSTLFLSINGTIGNIAFYNNENLMLGKSAAFIDCEPLLRRDFLAYFFDSNQCQIYFNLSVTGTTISNLGLDVIRSLKIPLPSIQEQTTILAFLDQETAKIDNLIQQAQKATTLLQERRTALISAAVTGKIDVRNKSLPASL